MAEYFSLMSMGSSPSENNAPLSSEDLILREMADHQRWGFGVPTLAFFSPYFYWKKHKEKVSDPRKIKAALGILNFQFTWCFIMASPFLTLFCMIMSPGLYTFIEEVYLYQLGYNSYFPSWSLLSGVLFWFSVFLLIKILFGIVWVMQTMKLKKCIDLGDYEARGILTLPFFK